MSSFHGRKTSLGYSLSLGMQLNYMQGLVSKRHLVSLFNYYTCHGQVTEHQCLGENQGNKAPCVLLGEIKWKGRDPPRGVPDPLRSWLGANEWL